MFRLIKKIMVVCLGLFLTLFAGAYLWLNPGRGPCEEIDPNLNGFVEEVENTLVVHLKGTPYEMGFQRGVFAKEKVFLTMARFDALLEEAKEEMHLPRFAANLILDATWAFCDPYIPERFKREMEGLSDAAGIDLRVIRRGHVLSVITERGCSSFAVWGRATVGGKLYQGRNFDWILSAGLEDTALLALYEPDGLNRFASVGYAGLIGVLSGLNMEGISIGQIGAVTRDRSLRGLPLEFVQRRVLEESRNIDQATQLMNTVKHTVGFNYVIADGKAPDARAYETTASHVAVFGPNDPGETVEYAIRVEDAVFRSDEAMDQTVRSLQDCANAPQLPYGSNSYDHRYKGMAEGIKAKYGAIDQAAALNILKATAMDGANLHAVLANSTDLELWVAHAKGGQEAFKQAFVHYDLKRLFQRPPARAAETPSPIADPPVVAAPTR